MDTIVCHGDSITEGHNGWDNTPGYYPVNYIESQYEYMLFKRLNDGLEPNYTRIPVSGSEYITTLDKGGTEDFRIINAGRGGYRVDELIPRLQYDVQPYAPCYVIALGGVNDVASMASVVTIQSRLTTWWDNIISMGCELIIGTMTPSEEAQPGGIAANPTYAANLLTINDWIRQQAVTRGLDLIDFYNIMVDPARPGFPIPGDGASDQIHFTIQGYTRMGNNIPTSIFISEEEKFYTLSYFADGGIARFKLLPDADVNMKVDDRVMGLNLVPIGSPTASNLHVRTDMGTRAFEIST